MFQRRQFLGALTTGAMTSAIALTQGPKLAFAAEFNGSASDDLKWPCQVIDTIAHNKGNRSPVVTGVCLQPGGNLMTIVGDDHHVNIYDLQTKSYVDHIASHDDWVRATQFSADGKALITAGNDRTVRMWSIGQWASPVWSRRHAAAIIDIALSSDGKQLATVGFEKKIYLYDLQRGVEIQLFEGNCDDNHAVAFSQDDRRLAVGGRCGTLMVWDLATGNSVYKKRSHRKRIRTVAFAADGRVISGGDDQIVTITDVDKQTSVALPRLASKLYTTELVGNGMLATGGSDNQIHIWSLGTLAPIGKLTGHTGTVTCLDFDVSRLVSGSYDTQVRVWQPQRPNATAQLSQPNPANGWNPSFK